MNRFWLGVVAPCVILAAPPAAFGQETLQQVKALYSSAAYEDALSMVGRLLSAERRPEVEQYRVYCLIALGRSEEAEKAIASVVAADPAFFPDRAETSPRIQEMFSRVRRQLLPDIAQGMYLRGRAAWDRQDFPAAISHFTSLLALMDSSVERKGTDTDSEVLEPMWSELHLLASGFLDLARAVSAQPARPESRPRLAPSLGHRPEAAPDVVSAVPSLEEELPAWIPSGQDRCQRAYHGAIRVNVPTVGNVTRAEP